MTTLPSGQQLKITARQIKKRERKYPIIECFGPTIQGEGAQAGLPVKFIRFGGCGFRCAWCDTMYAVLPEEVKANSTMMTSEEIVEELTRLGSPNVRWIIFSGGDPALQHAEDLVQVLHGYGFRISIETQGQHWKNWIGALDMVCVSPKGPSSGMLNNWDTLNLYNDNCARMGTPMFFKVPIFSDEDIEFLRQLSRTFPERTLYASIGNPYAPGSKMGDANKAQTIDHSDLVYKLLMRTRGIAEQLIRDPDFGNVRIIPQLHVLLWGNERGK